MGVIVVGGTSNPPPFAPTLISPASGSYLNLATTPTFSWSANPAGGNFVQTAWQFSILTNGASSALYWNVAAAAFQTTSVFNAGPAQSYTFPSGAFADGNVYQWTVVTQDINGTSPPAAYFTVTGQQAPVVTVFSPAGTVPASDPVVSWSGTYPPGSTQTSYRVVIYNNAQYSVSGFAPGTGPSTYDSGIVGTAYQVSLDLSQVPFYLPNNTQYRAYVQVSETNGQFSTWAYSPFTVSYAPPKTPTVTAAPGTDPVTDCPLVAITFQGHDNYLSEVDANPVLGLGSWGNAVGCTLSSVTQGLGMESVAVGDMSASTAIGTAGYAAVAGTQYTAIASFLTAVVGRTCTVAMEWYDSGGVLLSTSTGGGVLDNISTPTQASVTATAPTNTAWVAVLATVESVQGGLSAPSAPTVTPEGTTGSTTYAYEVTASNAVGQTTPSASGSTTTGNATLSSTDYNLVSWPAVPLAAGSSGNLVYDSNLTNAIAAVGPTWGVTGTSVGTANGDVNVLDPGTTSAEWVFYGSTTASGVFRLGALGPAWGGTGGIPIPLVPGATYTLSAVMDGTNLVSGTFQLALYQSNGDSMNNIVLAAGQSGVFSATATIPSGVTEGYLQCVGASIVVTADGDPVSWSRIQLTETSTVQPYQAGPLWTYPVYRDVAGTYQEIGSTTALAFEDTGQAGGAAPPTANTTGELHYASSAGVFIGTDTTWGRGGLVGLSGAVLLRSDGLYVRGASQANPAAIPAATQLVVVDDYEVVPTVAYTYSGQVMVTFPPAANAAILSSPGSGGPATVTTTNWWEFNPLEPSTAVNAQPTVWQPVNTEQLTPHMVTGAVTLNMVANVMLNQDFSGTFEVFAAPVYVAFNALLLGQQTVFISSPWGATDSGYFRIGPQSGGMSTGMGTKAKDTTLLASTASAPHRTVAITAVAQPRPQV